MGQPIEGSNPSLSAIRAQIADRAILRATNSSVSAVFRGDSPVGPDDVRATADAVADVVPMVMRQMRKAARAAAGPALTVAQMRTLLFIGRHPDANLSALAEHLGIGLTGASGLVDRLVREGLVDRRIDPAERRRIQLNVTSAGRARRDAAVAMARETLASRLGELDADELGTVNRAMAILRDALAPAPR